MRLSAQDTYTSETPTSKQHQLRRLDKLSQLLDNAFPIPGTQYRFGLDGILGLIPGIGDTIGAALSTYIIFEAARLGVPKRILLRMIGNVAVETVVGAVPIVGDIFDIGWKANVKNVALLRAHGLMAERAGRSSRQISILVFALIIAVAAGLLALTILVLRLLYQLITA